MTRERWGEMRWDAMQCDAMHGVVWGVRAGMGWDGM